MARRQRWNTTAQGNVTGDRSSIGDNHVSAAIGTIKKWCRQEIAMQVEYSPTRDQLVHMLIPDDIVERLRAVKGIVKPRFDEAECVILNHMELTVDLEDASVPCPIELYPDEARAAPLLAALTTLKNIHEKYETVKHTLRWLNRNATPGAVRYYFPAAMTLCPESPALMELQHVPRIHTTPDGIASLLPVIRQAMGTVAACALMRADAPEKTRECAWVEIKEYTFQGIYDGVVGPEITTDSEVYFI